MNNELYHYGVKGMRWGVRRYQDKNGKLTSAGKKRYSDDEHNKEREEKIKKAVKIGAGVAGAFLVAYGAYKVSEMYAASNAQIDPATGFRLIKNETDAKDISKINPGRIKLFSKSTKNKEIIEGSSYNCMLCTTTYELRRRGYDVHAGYSTTGFTPDKLFPKIYKDYKGTVKLPDAKDTNNKFSNVEDFILKEGSGSRGNIMVWWKHGGGHSMIWENVNGRAVFKDGQTGRVYKNFASEILAHTSTKPIEMLRTDNLDINMDSIKPYVNSDTVLKTYADHGLEIGTRIATDPRVLATAAVPTYYGVRKRAISNYRKEHPNTELTDSEIASIVMYA